MVVAWALLGLCFGSPMLVAALPVALFGHLKVPVLPALWQLLMSPQHVSGGGPGPPQPILAARGTGAAPRPRGAMGLMDPFCCMGTEGV